MSSSIWNVVISAPALHQRESIAKGRVLKIVSPVLLMHRDPPALFDEDGQVSREPIRILPVR